MSTNGTTENHANQSSESQAVSVTDNVVLVSGGFRSSYEALIPAFAKRAARAFA